MCAPLRIEASHRGYVLAMVGQSTFLGEHSFTVVGSHGACRSMTGARQRQEICETGTLSTVISRPEVRTPLTKDSTIHEACEFVSNIRHLS
jgi:hypothetical protein